MAQKKYAAAQTQLVAGYEGMKSREMQIPPQAQVRLTEALQRLVQLYTAWEMPDKAAEWKQKLDAQANPKSPDAP